MRHPGYDEDGRYTLPHRGYVTSARTAAHRREEIDKWEGDTWHPALLDLNARIVGRVGDYTITQIKQKFGELSFYYSLPQGVSDEDREAVQRMVADATQFCRVADRNYVERARKLPSIPEG